MEIEGTRLKIKIKIQSIFNWLFVNNLSPKCVWIGIWVQLAESTFRYDFECNQSIANY